jgi:starch phosphorylase
MDGRKLQTFALPGDAQPQELRLNNLGDVVGHFQILIQGVGFARRGFVWMNGALTIGTLDGANVEIRDAVGHDNFFLFGLTAPEASARRAAGYAPRALYESCADLREAIDLIAAGVFSNGDRDLFRPLVDALLNDDQYMVLADFESYLECQERVAATWMDQDRWTRMSILNAARVGRFSSDRAIREYCRDIWRVKSVPVRLLSEAEVKVGFLQ